MRTLVKLDSKLWYEYILAGDSFVTLKSLRTGSEMSYHIQKQTAIRHIHHVRYRVESKKGAQYIYVGTIFDKKFFRLSGKSRVTLDSVIYVAFNYVIEKLRNGVIDMGVEIYHEGKCGRCGRRLNSEESMKTGYGSDCVSKIKHKILYNIS
jgi:hypothetical protein